MSQSQTINRVAGIVLAGGGSRRMGADKATLPFGPELLLQRVARIVGQVTSPVIVVAAKNQILPTLSPEVIVARDETTGRGPLEGIAAGLRILQNSVPTVDAAFITACDAPLISPTFIQRMIEFLDAQCVVAIPLLENIPQPLVGVYRFDILPVVEAMLAENSLAVRDLLKRIDVNWVPAERMREIDPDLLSLRNLNTPDDYRAALASAGFAEDNLP